jgi:hypothetical protein
MSTAATRIRNAIFERVLPLTTTADFKTVRIMPVMMLQPDNLPALTVSLLGERMTPYGDDNEGEPRFNSEVTIGISIVRGMVTPAELDAQTDADVDQIEQLLLRDTTFVRFGVDPRYSVGDDRREPFFEAVSGITRRRTYPQSGEAYFVEVRLEMSFRVAVDYEPLLPDELKTIALSARPLGTGPDTPTTGFQIVEETDDDDAP